MSGDRGAAEEIFQEAADLPAAERAAFIVRRCGADEGLRREVESLLRFVDSDEAPLLGRVRAPVGARGMPERIGRYAVVRVIGEGGMGVVYEAVQEHPRRTVALKLLRWALASPALIRRFEHEAEVLGQLAHPGIAQIYEAGSVQSDFGRQPFFAMELVSGRVLTEFASSRGMNAKERLELMARVCDAVHHAHQKGVIHRDLKPANILVTEEGQPKILDFGIARATDSDVRTMTRTAAGALMGTLPYMSPEQVSGDAAGLDTRSDVYSLGVILYELLAGKLPYDVGTAAIPEVARVIREEDPRPLTSVNLAFRGDVSTIVGKALQKERERRYQSAAELAADIRRYLQDEPIAARPPTAMYQLRKFARRNRALVGGAGATVAALLLGTVAASVQAVRATRNEAQANAYANRARIAAAAADLEMHNAGAARARLSQVPDDRRGWEWRYLSALSDRSLSTLKLESNKSYLAVGPVADRGERALVHSGGRLIVWDPVVGRVEAETATPLERATPVLSPDGKTIVCFHGSFEIGEGGGDGMVAYDSATLRELWRSTEHITAGPQPFMPLASGAGGTEAACRLVVGAGGSLSVRDARTGSELESFPLQDPSVERMCLLSDRRLIFEARDRTGVLNLGEVVPARTFPIRFAVPIDGGRGVVGIDGHSLVVIDVESGRETVRIPRAVQYDARLAASPDGRWAALSEAKGSIVVWDLRSASRVTALHGHEATPHRLAYAPSSDLLLSVDAAGVVKSWDARAMPSPHVVSIPVDGARSTTISEDGSVTATCGWGSASVWDVRKAITRWSRVHWRNREGIAPACAFSPDGSALLVAGWSAEAALFESASGDLKWRVQGANPRPVGAAWERSGEAVVIVGGDGSLQKRARADGSVLASAEGRGHVAVMAIDRGGERIACAAEGSIRLWSMGSLTVDSEWIAETPICMAFSADGRLLATADPDRTLCIYDVATGRKVGEGGSSTPLNALAFAPDGSRLVGAGKDGSIRIFQTAPIAEVLMLDLPTGVASSLRLRRDDTLLLAGPRIGVGVFDLAPGRDLNGLRRTYADGLALADAVHGELWLTAPVVERLRRMDSIDDDVRRAAIEAAEGRGDQLNYVNSSAWGDCRFPGLAPSAYELALKRAETVCQQWPGERSFLNTLGVAQYRMGQYERAIASLSESDRLLRASGGATSDPEDAAFLAMAYKRLGNEAEAGRWLEAAAASLPADTPPSSERAMIVAEARAVVGAR